MGASIAGAALGVGTNVVSNGLNSLVGIRQTSYNAHLQEEQNALDREFNHNEAELARNWSTNERLAQQAYNTSEREATQQYNSPQAQAQRLRAAGINPAVYFSGSGPSAVASQPQSSGIPSASQASFSGGASPVVPNIPQLMTGASDLINAFINADVGKHNIALIDANVEKALQEVYTEQQIGELKKLEVELNKSTLPYKVKMAIEDLAAIKAQIALTKEDTEKRKLEQKLIKAQTNLTKATTKLRGFEAASAKVYSEKAGQILDSQIASNFGAAEEHQAGAALKREQVNTEISVQKLNGFKSDLAEIERNFNQSTFDTRLKTVINKLSISEWDAVLKRVEAKDKDAYTTVQRILLGKSTEGDDVKKLLRILHDIDMTSDLPNANIVER